jgi:hypothetical protein
MARIDEIAAANSPLPKRTQAEQQQQVQQQQLVRCR